MVIRIFFSWARLRDGHFRLFDRRLPLRAVRKVLSLTQFSSVCFLCFLRNWPASWLRVFDLPSRQVTLKSKQKKMELVTRAVVWQEILSSSPERYGALCPSDNGTGSKLRSPDGWTLHSWFLCRSNPRRCTHLRQVWLILAHYFHFLG